MANYVYIATSLDGFIATSDGGTEWLDDIPNAEQTDYGFVEFMSGIDALVMGRNSFEKVLTFGNWSYEKPVFVLSNSLTAVPETLADKVKVLRGDIVVLVNELRQRGYQNLYIDGGKVIQNFLKEDLIDEMIIARVPILLGTGLPLFGELNQSLKFRHKSTKTFSNGIVLSHYIRER